MDGVLLCMQNRGKGKLMLGPRNRIFSGKAGVAAGKPSLYDFGKAFPRKISQRVRPNKSANFLFIVPVGDELPSGRNVGAKIAGVLKWW